MHAAELLFQLGTPINVFLSDEMRDGSVGRPIFEGCRLLPIREFMELWSALLRRLADRRYGVPCDEPDGSVRAVTRSRYWIPIAADDRGNTISYYMDPIKGGKVGQIIATRDGVGPIRVLAPRFGDFLEQFVANLENGMYLYEPTTDSVKRIDGTSMFSK